MDKKKVFELIKEAMVELFELDPSSITLEAHIADDLELDSIDAVDLIVHLQQQTKIKIKPEEFKAVKTVDDIVSVVVALLEPQEG
ncbi:acyl carrier protein [Vibrio taketomensis]|uniref:acyl carrier protein n=1 Tax=Vibrio taketomensis TaxID=2572923 RepID=UPI00138A3668|nr:acyl carrier protein [Vibrio taketomensis]